jgi:hypothetical protein
LIEASFGCGQLAHQPNGGIVFRTAIPVVPSHALAVIMLKVALATASKCKLGAFAAL